ncbi:hypothetical protein [Imbroritus primus]|uniref:hypothetical protein n=1 Tax=Imbroritus primus TaxID=3058603 RepID=UPI003D161041
MRKIILTLIACVVILLAIEVTLRSVLFRHVSYSNSESIDRQLKERNARSDWNILFVGDSETRWGINPEVIDAELAASGLRMHAFNHAFDGFGASWWPALLPKLLAEPALKNVKYVAVGVQMIDVHRRIRDSGEDCGALQKPVLTSPFAKDLGVDGLCRDQSWDGRLGKEVFGALWTVRHAPSVRALILPSFRQTSHELRFNSRKSGESVRGFEPHRSIAQDKDSFESEFARWKAQYNPERDFGPLPEAAWIKLTASGEFFDQLNEVVRKQGRSLVLFALPTNPLVIDTFGRRDDYRRNSALLAAWAQQRGVIFLDAGIRDVPNPDNYFSDMRHLSGEGALHYSQWLGKALAARLHENRQAAPEAVRR